MSIEPMGAGGPIFWGDQTIFISWEVANKWVAENPDKVVGMKLEVDNTGGPLSGFLKLVPVS